MATAMTAIENRVRVLLELNAGEFVPFDGNMRLSLFPIV
jgi:hypothetical protein